MLLDYSYKVASELDREEEKDLLGEKDLGREGAF